MTNIYLVRHCECEANIEQRLAGRTDFAVTEKGRGQLNGLAERFRHVKLDAVYTSPLSRTRATAEAIARYNGAPVSVDERFIEFNFGAIDGTKVVDQPKEIMRSWREVPHRFSVPDGDSMDVFSRRAWESLLALVKENEGKTIAVATHGNVLRVLARALRRLPEDQLVAVRWSGNTAVHQVQFMDSENWEYLLENDTSHVPQEFAGALERLQR